MQKAFIIVSTLLIMSSIIPAEVLAQRGDDELPEPVLSLVLEDAVQRFGVASTEVEIVSHEMAEWGWADLGCPDSEASLPAITPGYIIIIEAIQQQYEYHVGYPVSGEYYIGCVIPIDPAPEPPWVCIGGTGCNGVPYPNQRPPIDTDAISHLIDLQTCILAEILPTIAGVGPFADYLDAIQAFAQVAELYEHEGRPVDFVIALLPYSSCLRFLIDELDSNLRSELNDCLLTRECSLTVAKRLDEFLTFESVRAEFDSGGGGLWSLPMVSTKAHTLNQVESYDTWLWGPMPSTSLIHEYYLGSYSISAPFERLNNWRSVIYFDKSRMEITNPEGDPNSPWHITNGLLAQELATGLMQMGDEIFVSYPAAQVNVAGDADDPTGPTYHTIGTVMFDAPYPEGSVIITRINRDGEIWEDVSLQGYGVSADVFTSQTEHRIANVFWDFMISTESIYGSPYYVTGLPISEAYWANVKVGGEYKDVLLQCFERRCMTYTPSNTPSWRVEMGNIGQHYYSWRYGPLTPTDPNHFWIGGFVYQDLNRNLRHDPGELPLEGVTIELQGPTTGTTTTDSEGKFLFRPILPGNYALLQFLNGTQMWRFGGNKITYPLNSRYFRIPIF